MSSSNDLAEPDVDRVLIERFHNASILTFVKTWFNATNQVAREQFALEMSKMIEGTLAGMKMPTVSGSDKTFGVVS